MAGPKPVMHRTYGGRGNDQQVGVPPPQSGARRSSGRTTDHGGEVAGGQHVFGVQREEDDRHGGQDEIAEGDVHRRLATPVRRRDQAGDPQGRPALDLGRRTSQRRRGHISIISSNASVSSVWSSNATRAEKTRVSTSLSCVWSIAKYAGIPAASIPRMMASMYTRV